MEKLGHRARLYLLERESKRIKEQKKKEFIENFNLAGIICLTIWGFILFF